MWSKTNVQCKIDFFAYAETNERTFDNTHPWRGPRMNKHGVINICAVSSSVNSLAPEKYHIANDFKSMILLIQYTKWWFGH